MEVTLEDQKHINQFSVLTSQLQTRRAGLSTVIQTIATERDALAELDLVLDEDEPIL